MGKGRRKGNHLGLAPREQQLLDLLYQHGPCTAKDLETHLNHDLNNASIRTILRALESKGVVEHQKQGNQFIYQPTEDPHTAAQSVFERLSNVFFSGSKSTAFAQFIDQESKNMDMESLEALSAMIEQAKKARKE